MNTIDILLEQAELHKTVNENYDSFTARLAKEGSLTESAYRNAEELLQDWTEKFDSNNAFLIESLDKNHDYIVNDRAGAFNYIAKEFRKILGAPIIGTAKYRKSFVKTYEPKVDSGESAQTLSSSWKPTPAKLSPVWRIKDTEADKQRRQREERQRNDRNPEDDSDRVRDQSGYQGGHFARTIASLLYDFQRDDEDEVPSFDDSPQSWLRFKAMFTLHVHEKNMPALKKLSILTAKMVGNKGKMILENIAYLEDNYDYAWRAVVDAFHQTNQLIRVEMQAFMDNMEPLNGSRAEKGKQMRALEAKMKRFTRNMRLILTEEEGEDEYFSDEHIASLAYDAMIVYKLEAALDETEKLEWATSRRGNLTVPSIEEFFEFLKHRSDALEFATDPRLAAIAESEQHGATVPANEEQEEF